MANPGESAFIHIPLREDDAQYADLDGIWMKEVLNEVIQFSQDDKENGNLFWGRNLGTESHRNQAAAQRLVMEGCYLSACFRKQLIVAGDTMELFQRAV